MKHFDWHVGDFEPDESPEPTQTPRRWLTVAVIASLLVVISAAAVWWQQTDTRRLQEQVEKLEAPIGVETAAQGTPNQPQVLSTNFRGNLATVEIIIPNTANEAYSLRQTWFYRYGDNTWERIPADFSLWGGERETQTQHFRFIFHELDQQTVDSLTNDVENLYADLLVGMGDNGLNPARKFTVEIVPELFPARSMQPNWIRLASPRSQTLHPSLTDRDALAWDLAHRLSYQLLLETAFMAGVTSPNTRFMLQCILPPAIAQRWGAAEPRTVYERQQYLRSLVSWFGWPKVDMSDMGRWPSTGWRKPQHECITFGDFIIARFGYEGLGSLVQAAGQTYGWEQVVEKGLGMTYDEFMREWRRFVEQEYAFDRTA